MRVLYRWEDLQFYSGVANGLPELVARGATISRAVDVAEVCRRRNGHIAQGLPETVNIQHLKCESEEVDGENGVRTVSVIRIDLEGIGDVPSAQDD